MTDVTSVYVMYRRRHLHRSRHRHTADPAEKDVRGRTVGGGGTRARLGAAAELVAPLGCVTGSARYLFLIRPDGDGDDYDGGGVVGPAEVWRNWIGG